VEKFNIAGLYMALLTKMEKPRVINTAIKAINLRSGRVRDLSVILDSTWDFDISGVAGSFLTLGLYLRDALAIEET